MITNSNNNFTVRKEKRPDPTSVIRVDGIIFDVGDTVAIYDECSKEVEIVIGGFSYDEHGELCFQVKEKMQFKHLVGLLGSSVNKSKKNISDAIALLEKNSYEVKFLNNE